MGVVDGVEEDLSAGGHVSDLDGALEEGRVAAGGAGGEERAAVGVGSEALRAGLVGRGGGRAVQLEGLDEGVGCAGVLACWVVSELSCWRASD